MDRPSLAPVHSSRHVYDFGDSGEHDVVLEAIGEAQPDVRYPRVIAGKRACSPEDIGGSSGDVAFVEAISEPTSRPMIACLNNEHRGATTPNVRWADENTST